MPVVLPVLLHAARAKLLPAGLGPRASLLKAAQEAAGSTWVGTARLQVIYTSLLNSVPTVLSHGSFICEG